jgi:hypothetical protein
MVFNIFGLVLIER